MDTITARQEGFEDGYKLALDRMESLLRGAIPRIKQERDEDDSFAAGDYEHGEYDGRVYGMYESLEFVRQVRDNPQ